MTDKSTVQTIWTWNEDKKQLSFNCLEKKNHLNKEINVS